MTKGHYEDRVLNAISYNYLVYFIRFLRYILQVQNWFRGLRARNDAFLLLFWIVIGGVLRFNQLTAKPPWTDEFATMVFSLGNYYQSVPLNQVISLNTLLQPLHLNPDAGIKDIVSLLLNEDNHPPLYFVLAHLWMKLFPSSGDYISLFAARSLPALFGVLSILAMYFCGRIVCHSRLVAQLAAAMMAVSPYGIFLAQEARHYTLAILFVIASFGCLMIAIKAINQKKTVPFWLGIFWIIINGLGLSVHFFFGLTLFAEGITLVAILFYQIKQKQYQEKFPLFLKLWYPMALVALGTMTTGLIWIFIILSKGYGNGMTDWLRPENFNFLNLISPPFQLLAAWMTMVSILPIESDSVFVVIVSGLIMLLFFIWVVPFLKLGFKLAQKNPEFYLEMRTIVVFLGSAIAVFLGITYLGGFDITRGARYNFVYFPAIILLLGIILAECWQNLDLAKLLPNKFLLRNIKSLVYAEHKGKIAVILILLMGFFSSLTVDFNLGYRKYYRPDQLISILYKNSVDPVLIATTHKTLVQTGEMMGIAWELKQKSLLPNTLFLLAHEPEKNSPMPTLKLQQAVQQLPRPLEVWTVNFQTPVKLDGCTADSQAFPNINGYAYQRYHCPKQ